MGLQPPAVIPLAIAPTLANLEATGAAVSRNLLAAAKVLKNERHQMMKARKSLLLVMEPGVIGGYVFIRCCGSCSWKTGQVLHYEVLS